MFTRRMHTKIAIVRGLHKKRVEIAQGTGETRDLRLLETIMFDVYRRRASEYTLLQYIPLSREESQRQPKLEYD